MAGGCYQETPSLATAASTDASSMTRRSRVPENESADALRFSCAYGHSDEAAIIPGAAMLTRCSRLPSTAFALYLRRMNIAADIAPIVAAWPPPSVLRLADSTVSRENLAGKLAIIEETLARDFAVVREDAAGLAKDVLELKARLGQDDLRAADLEDLVLKLEDTEWRIKRDARLSKLAKEFRKKVAPLGRDLLERYDHCISQFLDYRRFVLTALRDARWGIIAIDAMRQDNFPGPAFDSPKALRRYLSKHAH